MRLWWDRPLLVRSLPVWSSRPQSPACVRGTPLLASVLRPLWTAPPSWCRRWPTCLTAAAPRRTCAPWRSRAPSTPPLTSPPSARRAPPPPTAAAPAWNTAAPARYSAAAPARNHDDGGHSDSSHSQDHSPDWSLENIDALGGEEPMGASPVPTPTHTGEKASRTPEIPPALPPPSPASASNAAAPAGVASGSACPSLSPRLRGHRLCFSVWSPPCSSSSSSSSSSASQHPSNSTVSCSLTSDRPRPHRPGRRYRKLAQMARSTSDPISCASVSGSDSCGCASASNQQPEDSPQTSPEPAACSEHTAVVVSYQSSAKPSAPGCGKQKAAAKVDIRLKPRGLQVASRERPHSLADFKTYKDTKVLVAKFLEHSSCSLPLEVQQVVNSIKFVIKSDERHMEEAIFSANIIDQVMTQSPSRLRSPRKRLHEDLHLQSCGALSSPSSFRHRSRGSRSPGPPEPPSPPGGSLSDRHHSLISVCRETIL
ncbi:hypothetical protein SKAU_G00308330 [Synaphobranchus kaupii]|uniref:Uncharacterized protein n=1 Tax=Synaphobranchus kaupii TaxID=118154 RepID=A0A9Q1ER21_SYNKA|nr:hypothetical protein SKAU_G00308330 [Synaphobranchus kaupii]